MASIEGGSGDPTKRSRLNFLSCLGKGSSTWLRQNWHTAVVLVLVVVRRWVELPSWFFWSCIACWVLKDVILFPFVWRAYDWDRAGNAHSMVGLRGEAVEQLAPTGYVRVRGELWRAEVVGERRLIEAGETVAVRGSRGLTLLVDAYERNAAS